eukprot:SAG11_NODE_10566_length_821_cov_0.702216_2_plen_77_part_00
MCDAGVSAPTRRAHAVPGLKGQATPPDEVDEVEFCPAVFDEMADFLEMTELNNDEEPEQEQEQEPEPEPQQEPRAR